MTNPIQAPTADIQATNAMYDRAVELFDAGYSITDSDFPGQLRSRFGKDAIQVPIEIWFFVCGAIFGMGHAMQELRKR